jgi:hypothetical protein
MNFDYSGEAELELFSSARNWKTYWSDIFKSKIDFCTRIVEVGSGMGSNVEFLMKMANEYIGIEPDVNLVQRSPKTINANFMNGFSGDFQGMETSTLAYIDVLEHIEDDRKEIENAVNLFLGLRTILIVVPAHQFLYSELDKKVGHFRRYDKNDVQRLSVNGTSIMYAGLHDSIGFIFSLLNRVIRSNRSINKKNILIWDKLIPLSRRMDELFNFRIGKSWVIILEVAK